MKEIKTIIRYLIRLNKYIKGKKDSVYTKEFLLWIFCGIVIFLIICFLPLLLSRWSIIPLPNGSNEIGDTIGGIMGPFVAMVAAFLTFIAFWIQYKANEQQKLQIRNQEKDIRIERFESKFFELLALHRQNISEIQINDQLTGRRAFEEMFKELEFCHAVVTSYVVNEYTQKKTESLYDVLNINITSEDIEVDDLVNHKLTQLSYLMFYFGTPDSKFFRNELFKLLSKHYSTRLLIGLFIHCRFIKASFSKKGSTNPKVTFPTKWEYSIFAKASQDRPVVFNLEHRSFNGHQSRLSHYFRHLYQLVTYIINPELDFLDSKARYSYLKTIRSQMSDYEFLLLYYNGITFLGNEWINKQLFTEWLMLKNIPLPLACFGYIPTKCFKEEMQYSKRFNKHIFSLDD